MCGNYSLFFNSPPTITVAAFLLVLTNKQAESFKGERNPSSTCLAM